MLKTIDETDQTVSPPETLALEPIYIRSELVSRPSDCTIVVGRKKNETTAYNTIVILSLLLLVLSTHFIRFGVTTNDSFVFQPDN